MARFESLYWSNYHLLQYQLMVD